MSQFRVRLIQTSDELRRSAVEWDELWRRSDVASPTARAEVVALRVDHLAAGGTFRGLVVEHDGRMVAALPLIGRKLKGVLHVGSLPCNYWVSGGALMLDCSTDAAAALDCMVTAIEELPWPLLWLDQVAFDDSVWQAFRAAAARAGLSVSVREHYQIGQVEISEDWQTYTTQRIKGDRRRKLNRRIKMLEDAGGADLKIYRDIAPEQLDELVRRGFEVEDRSWKAAEGTSVLKNPAIFEQYRTEAKLLNRLGILELVFLENQGQPMAFVYGYHAKGVHFVTKLGCDESFAKFAPGQQLFYRWLEQLHAGADQSLLDFAGPLLDYHKTWTTCSYPIGTLVVASPRLFSRGLFHVYTQWQPRMKRLKQRISTSFQTLRTAAVSTGAKLGRVIHLNRPTPQAATDAAETES